MIYFVFDGDLFSEDTVVMHSCTAPGKHLHLTGIHSRRSFPQEKVTYSSTAPTSL